MATNQNHIAVVLEAIEEKWATEGTEHPGYDVLKKAVEAGFSAMGPSYDIDDPDDFDDLAALSLMSL